MKLNKLSSFFFLSLLLLVSIQAQAAGFNGQGIFTQKGPSASSALSVPVPVTQGGTGATTVPAARAALGATTRIPYVSGRFYPTNEIGNPATAANSVVSDTLYAAAWEVRDDVTISQIGIEGSSANPGIGSSFKGCVYSVDPATAKPQTLLGACTTGVATVGATTAFSCTLSTPLAVTVGSGGNAPYGWLYIATLHTTTTTAAQFYSMNAVTRVQNIYQQGSTDMGGAFVTGANAINYYTGSATYASGCPASFPTATAVGGLTIIPTTAIKVN